MYLALLISLEFCPGADIWVGACICCVRVGWWWVASDIEVLHVS